MATPDLASGTRPSAGRVLPVVALALIVLAVYLVSPVIQSGDGRLVVYEADSVLRQQNLDLHEFGPIVHGFPCYRERNRILSRYPYGTSLVTAPILAAVGVGGRLVGRDPTASLREHPPRKLEKALASIIAALAVVALVLLAREALGRVAPALLLGATFAFGTALWSTVSRGLWQHGPAILLLTAGVFCLVRGGRRDDWRWLSAAGLPFAAAYVVRPTAAIPLALTGLVLLATHRKAFLGFAAVAVCVLLPSLAYNLHVYGKPVVPFYFLNGGFLGSGLRPTFLTGLAGTMVSPSRGLLVYSPFVALAAVGLWLRRHRLGRVELVAIGTVLAIWIVTANTKDWPGGWSYGPRLLSDTLPFLAYLMLPAVDTLARARRTWSPLIAGIGVVLVLSLSWSVFVNARGAISWSTQIWNARPQPAGVETHPERFWDWGDPPFLRTGRATFTDIYPYSTPPEVPVERICIE